MAPHFALSLAVLCTQGLSLITQRIPFFSLLNHPPPALGPSSFHIPFTFFEMPTSQSHFKVSLCFFFLLISPPTPHTSLIAHAMHPHHTAPAPIPPQLQLHSGLPPQLSVDDIFATCDAMLHSSLPPPPPPLSSSSAASAAEALRCYRLLDRLDAADAVTLANAGASHHASNGTTVTSPPSFPQASLPHSCHPGSPPPCFSGVHT
jgi:hypothetical protein